MAEELLPDGSEEPRAGWLTPDQVLSRLESLGSTLREVTRQLRAVSNSSAKTRHLAIGLAVSLVLDVVLTVAVSLLTIRALNQGSSLHASQLAACAIGNQTRSDQQHLWEYLVQETGGVKTAQEKQFLAYVDKTFMPVNCAAVYHK